MKVTEIMSRPVVAVTPATSLKAAAQLLVEHGISALPVLDAHGDLVGIVSEADLVAIEARPKARMQATPLAPTAGTTPSTVAEVMTRRVITVPAGSEVSQAARAMLAAGVKRVPITRGRRVVGIVSRRDLMRVIARQDDSVRDEVAARVRELGVMLRESAITVSSGVVSFEFAADAREQRLVEAVALEVPGVLEVRFGAPQKA